MRFITYIIVFFLVVIGFTFACLNAEAVSVNYYFAQKEIPLSLLIALGLFTGGILGWVSSLGLVIKLKKDHFILHQKFKHAEKELENLRQIPLEDKR